MFSSMRSDSKFTSPPVDPEVSTSRPISVPRTHAEKELRSLTSTVSNDVDRDSASRLRWLGGRILKHNQQRTKSGTHKCKFSFSVSKRKEDGVRFSVSFVGVPKHEL